MKQQKLLPIQMWMEVPHDKKQRKNWYNIIGPIA